MLAWMFYAALVGGIVAAAAMALERLAANTGRPRRIAWLAALALAGLIPVTGGLRKPEHPAVVAAGEVPEFIESVPDAGWTIVPVLPLPTGHDPTRTAKVAWAAGSAATLAVLASLLTAVARARNRWPRQRVDGTDVRVSRRFGPALVGVTRPDIVLPAWVLGLQPPARSAIVRHEQEHARARDHLALLYAGLMLAAFPWSPAIWWMCRRLRAAVEIDCDQRVIASGIGAADYGAVLLAAGSRSHARWGLALAMGQPRSLLERRLKTMSEGRVKLRMSQTVLLAGAALVALAIACDARAPTQIDEATDGAVAEAHTAGSADYGGGASRIAGIVWEDAPVVEWGQLRFVGLYATEASDPEPRPQLVYHRNETPVGFANSLMGPALFHPAHRKFDPDLRAEYIEVDADRIRIEGNWVVVRGGIVKVRSAEEDDEPRDRVLLSVGKGDSFGIFVDDRLGIAVTTSRPDLIEDLNALW